MVYSFGWRSPVALLLFCVPCLALSSPWEQVNAPSEQSSQAIGSYANGCLAGASPLPLKGVGYQVLRSHRQRYYAHPSAVSFVQRFGKLSEQYLNTHILVGDLSLPQGGRFSSGHTSHQTGLDIDIWLRLTRERLPEKQLRTPVPISVVNIEQYQLLKENWDARHFELIKMAAYDSDVERIFVHPVIKEKLCAEEELGRREWLRKVRPWWGHHYHMHVRLKCPQENVSCKPQVAPPDGDGCGAELVSWRPQPKPQMSRKVNKKKSKVIPVQCQQMLDNI
ncbi:penicillin-insensitive murein endopeptidase [Vibrio pectenicida]|uniref:Penicillin-insensitive murein endopeptidase n=1 Tax=Vibrio pectenicida TaxID=62763 RepID=A0A427U6K7_9VIBR|nr:penicillin-insensitive murein endopeptidase [Vibrio pectenicida]RSD32298.1 penicillin-insensitive murein endopeptidase [Vibrio pectenicida]